MRSAGARYLVISGIKTIIFDNMGVISARGIDADGIRSVIPINNGVISTMRPIQTGVGRPERRESPEHLWDLAQSLVQAMAVVPATALGYIMGTEPLSVQEAEPARVAVVVPGGALPEAKVGYRANGDDNKMRIGRPGVRGSSSGEAG